KKVDAQPKPHEVKKPAAPAKADGADSAKEKEAVAKAKATVASVPSKASTEPEPGDIVLRGKIVTMDDKHTGKMGCVLVSKGIIKAILPEDFKAPDFCKSVDTKGVIYPGLMNLHNHTAYNFLPLYDTKGKDWGNRDQWPSGKDYEEFVNNPKNL